MQAIYITTTLEGEAHAKSANAVGFGFRRFFSVTPGYSYEQTLTSTVNQTHVYLEFDNDEEREIGEQFLRDNNGIPGVTTYFVRSIFDDEPFLEEDPGPEDAWKKLLYEKSVAWQTTGSNASTSTSYGVNGQVGFFPIGPFFPFGGAWDSAADSYTTDGATYLGAPQDGTRPRNDYAECLARPDAVWLPPLEEP